MANRSPLFIFVPTIFLGAFLLFAVQPMTGKMLLPLLGGGPSVWNTAMVFFQAMLLVGYAYAHFIAKYLPLRLQAFLHIGLMLLFLFCLPLALPDGTVLPKDGDLALWQLGIMFVSIGGPFFILAASAPLFQYWFACSSDQKAESPYFLYAVSNAGSLGALLLYPLIIEPEIGLRAQSLGWAGGYIMLAVFAALCAFIVRNGTKPAQPFNSNILENRPGWKTKLGWVALSFVPSSLMLGVTTIITMDVASAPLLWALPLALYLLTFIIAFSKARAAATPFAREMAGYAICFTIMAFMITGIAYSSPIPLLFVHLAAFFFCALFCHCELSGLKPDSKRLTEYYLFISIGGVLGGAFNALIAPNLFTIPFEYALVLGITGILLWAVTRHDHDTMDTFNASGDPSRHRKTFILDCLLVIVALYAFFVIFMSSDRTVYAYATIGVFFFFIMIVRNRRVFAPLALAALLVFEPSLSGLKNTVIALERNYFGVLRVTNNIDVHEFSHGTTLHGSQKMSGTDALLPVSYYSVTGPVGDIFQILGKEEAPQKIAALGLGVGSIASYAAPGRTFDFYEIDKDVAEIAKNPKYFTYLTNSGEKSKVIIGDARQRIADAPDGSYDMIFIDTFSSDNIPFHIITREALAIYKRKLKLGGFIAVNISNRYLNLKPVIDALAKDAGMVSYFKFHVPHKTDKGVESLYVSSQFAVIATSPRDVAHLIEDYNWQMHTGASPKVWTDDYANVLSSLWILDKFNR